MKICQHKTKKKKKTSCFQSRPIRSRKILNLPKPTKAIQYVSLCNGRCTKSGQQQGSIATPDDFSTGPFSFNLDLCKSGVQGHVFLCEALQVIELKEDNGGILLPREVDRDSDAF